MECALLPCNRGAGGAAARRAAGARSREDGMAWWRLMLGIEAQSLAERRASENAASLFFGALIGANLGTVEDMPIGDYILVIATAAAIVMYLQLVTVTRHRLFYALNLLAFIVVLWVLLLSPFSDRLFSGTVRPGPHLFWTIVFWLATILTIHMRPLRPEPTAATAVKPGEAA
jgi:hypothetical protein